MSGMTDLSANEAIYDSIRAIAYHRLVNAKTGAVKNTSKTSGFVVKIHDSEDDDLFGTVDVQEYTSSSEANRQAADSGLPVGLHEGVYLSALRDNSSGMVVVPYLHSDVVIATDPETLREYVIQYSHAKTVQLDAHETVTVGVTETEEYEESEDSPDVEDLNKTGLHAHTTYTKDTATTEVSKGDKSSETSSVCVTPDDVTATHDKASVVLDGDKVSASFKDDSQVLLDARRLLAKYGAKEIVINSGGVYVGSGSATEPAVLGNQLATLLVEWLGALSQVITPTLIGPQPPANVAKFSALMAKVSSYRAATAGILSKTVKIAQ